MSSPGIDRAVEEIEALRVRYEQLNKQRIQADTRLEETRKQLELLQKDAVDQWGTSDLNELQKMLVTRQAENERLRSAYQASLAAIEEGLKKIETKT